MKRNFVRSFVWSPDKCDFVLETPHCVYFVHLLAVKRYASRLCFTSATEIRYTSCHSNQMMGAILRAIFDCKPKVRSYDIDFSEVKDVSNMEIVRSIIANPTCMEMTYSDFLSEQPTGNGGSHFGYTVFTGTGFINYVIRNEKRFAV